MTYGAIGKEMTLKDWGSNTSRESFLPGFLWPFCFVLHFFTIFFYLLAGFNLFSYCCPITALWGVAINALSTFYVCELFKFSLHYFLISLVKQSSFSLGHRTMFCLTGQWLSCSWAEFCSILPSTLLLTKVSRSLYPQSKFSICYNIVQ